MYIEDYRDLQIILQEVRQELHELNEDMKYHLECIKQDDIFVRSFTDGESEDFKIFSPRRAEDIHKNEIERAVSDRENHRKKYDSLLAKSDILQERAKKIEKILEYKKNDLSILNLLENDRKRIAGELHDSSLQNLTHLVHKIELCSLYMDQDLVKAKLELSVITKILKNTIDEIRNTIFDLRPMTFDDLGFKAAIERLLLCKNESGKYEIEQEIEDVSCENDMFLLSVYRIIQECLNNIEKHSMAEKIWISCKNINDRYVIRIRDNGKGFDLSDIAKERHYGILMMRERVELLKGTIQFTSRESDGEDGGESGTEVHIEIPMSLV